MYDIDMSLREKIRNAFSQTKGFLFGDINFEEHEKEQIKKFCQYVINSGIPTKKWPSFFADILTANLIITTKNYSKDWTGKTYWDKILPELGFNKRLNYTTELPSIEDCFRNRKLPFFKTLSGESRYVESIFFQAFSPKTSVESFVSLAWKLFSDEEVFDYVYEEDLEYCHAIIKMLSRQYSGDELDEDIDFEGEKYSIRAGLRYAFRDASDIAAAMLNRILIYINKMFNYNEDIDDDTYLSKICTETIDLIFSKKTHNINNRKTFVEKKYVDDIKNFKSIYYFADNSLYLLLPKIRLYKTEKDYKKMSVTLYLNEMAMEIIENDVHGVDFKKCFPDNLIQLNKYFDDFCDENFGFRLEVKLDDDLIYNSKNELYREVFMFKNGREVKGTSKPNYYYFILPGNYEENNDSYFKNSMTRISNCVYLSKTEENDRLRYLNTSLFFNSMKRDSHYYFDTDTTNMFDNMAVQYNDNNYVVCSKLGTLNCVIENGQHFSSLILCVENIEENKKMTYPLLSFKGDNDQIITIPVLSGLEKGFYNCYIIDVSKNTNNVLFESMFVFDPKAKLEISDDLSFMGDSITVRGSILNNNFDIKKCITGESVTFEVEDIRVCVQIPFLNWRINQRDVQWKSLPDDIPILYGRHGNVQANDILFVDSSFEVISVRCGKTRLEHDKTNNGFKLGKFVLNGENVDDIRYGKVFAVVKTNNGVKEFPLFKLSNKPYVYDLDKIYQVDENDNIFVSLVNNFRGEINTKFVLKVEQIRPNNKSTKVYGYFAKEPMNLSEILDDGEYESSLYYIDSVGTLDSKIKLSENDIISVGNEASFRYDEYDVLILYKAVPSIKIKEQAKLSNIKYIEDTGFAYVYSCKLNTSSIRNFDCFFRTKSVYDRTIEIFYRVGNVEYNFSYDKQKGCVSKRAPDGENYELLSNVYYKD